MCGIITIIQKEMAVISEQFVSDLLDKIKHRGPDDCGISINGNIALGHRRLSIVDLSNAGQQPMHYQEKYTLVFNGEIYNFWEIREQLQKQGYQFLTGTDTEVILAAYDYWHEECLQQFNGMWAFVLYDKERNKLFCARDRFGIKPFYFVNLPEYFGVASEIKALLPLMKNVQANKQAAMEYLLYGLVDYNDFTFFEGVSRLPASHYMLYDLKDFSYQVKRYYEIPKLNLSGVTEEMITIFDEKFSQSLQLRLRSDVKVGTCLSGGLDSSLVASQASSFYHAGHSVDRFTAITAISLEKKFDESEYARQVVDYCNLNWCTVMPSVDDFKKEIASVIYTQEEPFGGPSIFMQYMVFKEAKQQNCKVMLDGQGGDECFLGYHRYCAIYFGQLLKSFKLIQFMREIFWFKKNNTTTSMLKLIKMYLGVHLPKLRDYIHRSRWKKYIQSSVLNTFSSSMLFDLAKASKNTYTAQLFDIHKIVLPCLLRYEDKDSMAHSIEGRLPFLDYCLVEFGVNLPADVKIKQGWTKYILRVSSVDLPHEIKFRKSKLNFNAPDQTFLTAIRDSMLETIKNSQFLASFMEVDQIMLNFEGFSLTKKWHLFNLAKWAELYGIKEIT